MAGVVEATRALVAQHDVAGRVDDHDGVTDRVERLGQPALIERLRGLRLGETVVGQQGTTTHAHREPSSSFGPGRAGPAAPGVPGRRVETGLIRTVR